MLKAGAGVFVQIPNEFNQRLLHRGSVAEVHGPDEYTAEFDPHLPLEGDLDVLIWYELNRDFMQHCARIERVIERRPKLKVTLETVGDPITGERRRHFRVPTASAGVTATFGGESACSVLDISSAGLAVVCRQSHPVGVMLEAALQFRAEEFRGRVCVQNSCGWGSGLTRYGVRALQTRGGASDLLLSLTQVSLAVQSEQLAGPR